MRQCSLSYRDSHCALNRTKSSYDNTELGRVIHSFQKTYKLLSAEGIKWEKKAKPGKFPKWTIWQAGKLKVSPYVKGTWVYGTLERSSLHSSISANSVLAGGANMKADCRRIFGSALHLGRLQTELWYRSRYIHLTPAFNARGYSGGQRRSRFWATGTLHSTSNLQSASAL